MAYDITPEQQKFFNEYCLGKDDMPYLYAKYGQSEVQRWVAQDWFVDMWMAFDKDQAAREEYALKKLSLFQEKALSNIERGLEGEFGNDHLVALSKWVMGGSRNFLDSLGKTKGEREADRAKSKRDALRVVRDGND